jgi:hypothetical protein
MPSKVAIDPEEPSLGRIRVDSIAPPHCPTSIKRRISRVERIPGLSHANLFADTLCDTPLKEGHISLLGTDGTGLSPSEPMAIVQVKKSPDPLSLNLHPSHSSTSGRSCYETTDPLTMTSIPDGKYAIRNRAVNLYWCSAYNPTKFLRCDMEYVKDRAFMQVNEYFPIFKCSEDTNSFSKWDITHDTSKNGNISITSSAFPLSWVGAEISGSTVPTPWRLIPVDSKFY